MKINKKIISIILALVLLMVTLNGCGSSEETTLTIDGKSVKVPYVVMIEGKKVSLDEYRYYFLNLKKSYDSGDEAVWETENTLKMLKLDVVEGIKESYAVWNLAEKNGIEISKTDEKTIEENINGQIESYGGEEKYQEALKASYMSQEFYHFLWETSIIYEKLNDFYFSEGGEYYNPDTASGTHEEEYAAKLKELVDSAMNDLKIEYGPEYDLITTKTLM